MRAAVIVTAFLLLLIALFPCYNVETPVWRQVGGTIETVHHERQWLPIFNAKPAGNNASVSPARPIAWPIMAVEIVAALAVGAIVWAIGFRPRLSPASPVGA